jgi:regulator of protease activity HflC (stomatin/prohibitin superfamily)/divalent metal cation (Fe/Co/Zn/Cd) transporter
MERSTQKNGLVNFLALLVVGVAGFAVARSSGTLAGEVTSLFLGMGLLVALVSWFQMRLEENERLERLELEELAKTHSGAAMFDAKDSEVFPAQRSREQFERFFVPGFAALLFLIQAGGAWWLWRWLSNPATSVPIKSPSTGLALFGTFTLILFLLGRFSATFARLRNDRLLRPGASHLLLDAFLCLAVAIDLGIVWSGTPKADSYIAYGMCCLLALVAVETLVALVLEIYRPRVKGKIERPLYDSRLVGLLSQPEGLITTAAQALDYQFGFKVSETWFYRLFFERALKWLLLLQVAALVLSTCFVFIDAGEQGLLERWGKPVQGRTILNPGVHPKWPWPIDKAYVYLTEQVQTIEVGFTPEEGREEETVVLWTKAHTKEDNFLVANRESLPEGGAANQPEAKRTPPVSFITGSIPIEFQITNLVAWVYTNSDAPNRDALSLLKHVATREVVRYCVSADMNELMSSGRLEASRTLAQRIQAAADERGLGVRILVVGLQDLHPPVKVAEDYEKVISATQARQAKILTARAEEIRTNAVAAGQAATLVNRAHSDRVGREAGARAQAALFTNQIPAFLAAPSVYAQRAYFQTFARATANARKYVMLTTNTHDVLIFDLEDKIRGDLLDLSVPAPKTTK